jgi:hypothetical protein
MKFGKWLFLVEAVDQVNADRIGHMADPIG